MKSTDEVDIVIWLTLTDVSNYVKPAGALIKERPEEERRLLEKAKGEKMVAVNRLKSFGVDVKAVSENYPCVHATLKAEHAQKLARGDDICKLYLDDRSARPALNQALAIARAPQAFNLGSRGAGVHVAVWEGGPFDTTDLDYAGRYWQYPPADRDLHSRMVSGVIKNAQLAAPNGFAPDCLLFSANSFFNDALQWAVQSPQACTVINQSFV